MATTPPSAPDEPLTLDQVKLNLRVDGDAENDRVTDLIVTAREHVEAETGLVLVPRLVTETARELGRWIELSSWPVTSIVEIRCPIASGMAALPGSAWRAGIARRPVRLLPTAFGWGATSCVRGVPIEIDVRAGYATPADVPMRVKQAMHMLVAHWYANRPAVETGQRAAAIDVPMGVDALLDKLRLRQV